MKTKMKVDAQKIIETWKAIIKPPKTWVVFEKGTCVILTDGVPREQEAAAEAATEIISFFGPVVGGTPAGDFSTSKATKAEGWIVTGAHPDVLNFVFPTEVNSLNDMTIGLFGRSKRDADGRKPKVIHVEIG